MGLGVKKDQIEKIRKKLRLWFAILLAVSFPFTIPWFHNLSSYIIWGFGACSMGYLAIDPKAIRRLLKPELWILTLPFLWALAGMVYSQDQAPGWYYIEKQLSLLIFPFFFVFGGGFSFAERKKVLFGFVLSLAVCLLIALVLSLKKNYELDQLRYFHLIFYSYHGLSSRIYIHAVYLSVYVGFAMFILLDQIFQHKLTFSRKNVGLALGVVYFGFFLTLLAAKMVLSAWAIVLLIFFFIKGKPKLGALVTLLAFVGFYFFFSSLGNKKTIQERLDMSMDSPEQIDWTADPENLDRTWNSLNMRLGLWLGAKEGIKKRPVFGPGTGDSDRLFNMELKKLGFEFAFSRNFNEHNQYLGILNTNGLVGLLFFALMFAVGFKVSKNRDDHLFTVFLTFLLFCFLTENYIEAQKGAIFIGFFFSFFFFTNDEPKTND